MGDGEKSAIKAWKILATKCRVFFHQEDCHGYWNDVRAFLAGAELKQPCLLALCDFCLAGNSISRSGLGPAALKATVLSTVSHGPHLVQLGDSRLCSVACLMSCVASVAGKLRVIGGKATGMGQFVKEIACKRYMEKYKDDEEHWLEMAEQVSEDTAQPVNSDHIEAIMADWGKAEAITNRGIYAQA